MLTTAEIVVGCIVLCVLLFLIIVMICAVRRSRQRKAELNPASPSRQNNQQQTQNGGAQDEFQASTRALDSIQDPEIPAPPSFETQGVTVAELRKQMLDEALTEVMNSTGALSPTKAMTLDEGDTEFQLIDNEPAGQEPEDIDSGVSRQKSNPLFISAQDRPTWYAGAMSKELCEQAVLSSPIGSFLVRDSLFRSKFVVCINDYGTVANYQIKVEDIYRGGYSFAGGTYRSLDDIIELLYVKPLPSKKKGKALFISQPAKFLDADFVDGALQDC